MIDLSTSASDFKDEVLSPTPGAPSIQVVTYWKDPETGKVVMARDGAQASELKAQGFKQVESPPNKTQRPVPTQPGANIGTPGGGAATDVVTYWKNPRTGEVVMARDGAQASELEARGFKQVESPTGGEGWPPDDLIRRPGPPPTFPAPLPPRPRPAPAPPAPSPPDDSGSDATGAGLLSASGVQTVLLVGLSGLALRQIMESASGSESSSQ